MAVATDRRAEILERELHRFAETHRRSAELRERARRSMPGGVPMSWMVQLHGHPPVYVDSGDGAFFTDVDGNRYLDTNIADTSMFGGYGPEPVVRAVADRTKRGTSSSSPLRTRSSSPGRPSRYRPRRAMSIAISAFSRSSPERSPARTCR